MPTSIDVLKEMGRRLRILSLKATTEAGSGHPTSSLSAADLVSVIFFNEMQFDPRDPHNPANDRFILSKGHAAPLLWAAYAEAGIIDEKDVLTLRRFDSVLEGHPTPRMPWVDVATGSLGQGLPIGVGVALAGKLLDKLPYHVWVLCGDSELAEGSIWEAIDSLDKPPESAKFICETVDVELIHRSLTLSQTIHINDGVQI